MTFMRFVKAAAFAPAVAGLANLIITHELETLAVGLAGTSVLWCAALAAEHWGWL